MADESSAVARWLYSRLSADEDLAGAVAGGVWEDPAPQGRPFPLLTYSLLSALEVEGHSKYRIYVDSLWLVKVVTIGHSYSNAVGIIDKVDDLLQRVDGTVPGFTIYSSAREGIVRYAETSEGVSYRHLGGQYRIMVQGV